MTTGQGIVDLGRPEEGGSSENEDSEGFLGLGDGRNSFPFRCLGRTATRGLTPADRQPSQPNAHPGGRRSRQEFPSASHDVLPH